jgi:hypothetical protein
MVILLFIFFVLIFLKDDDIYFCGMRMYYTFVDIESNSSLDSSSQKIDQRKKDKEKLTEDPILFSPSSVLDSPSSLISNVSKQFSVLPKIKFELSSGDMSFTSPSSNYSLELNKNSIVSLPSPSSGRSVVYSYSMLFSLYKKSEIHKSALYSFFEELENSSRLVFLSFFIIFF